MQKLPKVRCNNEKLHYLKHKIQLTNNQTSAAIQGNVKKSYTNVIKETLTSSVQKLIIQENQVKQIFKKNHYLLKKSETSSYTTPTWDPTNQCSTRCGYDTVTYPYRIIQQNRKDNTKLKKEKSKHKITWFNPPLRKNVRNVRKNVAQTFIKLLLRHFPK